MSMKPREIANEAEGHVIALPQQMLEILFAAAVGDSDSGEVDAAPIRSAGHFLDQKFETAFAASAGDVSEALSDARSELSAAVNSILRGLDTHAGEPHALAKLAKEVSQTVGPCVKTFLQALFDQVVSYEQSNAKRAQDVDNSALNRIDLIAKKINFIAVNASVEAARVGDLGRGFTVIASEIRDLSQQAKDAVATLRQDMA